MTKASTGSTEYNSDAESISPHLEHSKGRAIRNADIGTADEQLGQTRLGVAVEPI